MALLSDLNCCSQSRFLSSFLSLCLSCTRLSRERRDAQNQNRRLACQAWRGNPHRVETNCFEEKNMFGIGGREALSLLFVAVVALMLLSSAEAFTAPSMGLHSKIRPCRQSVHACEKTSKDEPAGRRKFVQLGVGLGAALPFLDVRSASANADPTVSRVGIFLLASPEMYLRAEILCLKTQFC